MTAEWSTDDDKRVIAELEATIDRFWYVLTVAGYVAVLAVALWVGGWGL
jgi:hypothetical protein